MQPANDNTTESAPHPAPADSRDEFLLAALGVALLLGDEPEPADD